MAFREKILWSSVVLTLVIWGWYFWGFAQAMRAGDFNQGAATGNFILTVVLLVVVHIVAAIVVTLMSGRSAQMPADDRERAFALAAYRPAYLAMTIGVVMLMLTAPILLRIALEWRPAPPNGFAPVLLGNALLLLLVLGELVHSGAQLIRFRMGG